MKIKDGFVLEEVGGSYLAIAVGQRTDEFTGLVKLNGTGAFLWNLMKDKDISREELADAVMAAYEDASRDVVVADVLAFEEKLRSNGILE